MTGARRNPERPRALVTGASRGIGKASATALAAAGFDIVASARTVHPGEPARDNSMTVRRTDARPLPGSLQETAQAVAEAGGECLIVPMDLTDRASVGAGAQMVLDRWGGVDLLVHNGRYLGPGVMDLILETPPEACTKTFEAHCIAPLILTRALLPGMLRRGRGQVITITSTAAYQASTASPAAGGWGLGYAVGKAAGHMLVGAVHVEHHAAGILAINLQPGAVLTERNALTRADYGRTSTGLAPPSAIGAVVAWLATQEEARAYAGQTIQAQAFCRERKLHPDWAA